MDWGLFTTFEDRVIARVGEVLHNLDCPWQPTYEHRRLLQELLSHKGAARAISRPELAARLGIEDRAVRELVQDLRLNFRVQIGSSRTGGGYYLMTDESDCLAASEQMIQQGVATIRTGLAMRGGRCDVVEMLGQIQLALDAPAKKGGA